MSFASNTNRVNVVSSGGTVSNNTSQTAVASTFSGGSLLILAGLAYFAYTLRKKRRGQGQIALRTDGDVEIGGARASGRFAVEAEEEEEAPVPSVPSLLSVPTISTSIQLGATGTEPASTAQDGLPEFSDSDISLDHGPFLGSGGQANVHAGLFKGRIRVAVKSFRFNASDPVAMRSFLDEARTWRRVGSHGHTLPLMAICKSPPRLVTQLMPHGNMREFLGRLGWSIDTGVGLLKQVAEGMEFIHLNSVVHGDLKFENVLVDSHEQARISDFGLARIRSSAGATTVNHSGRVGGTIKYMAPEVLLEGRNPNYPADVYAFAFMLYEVAGCGEAKPHRDMTENQIRAALINGTRPTKPRSVDVDSVLWRLVEDCWVNEPRERPNFSEVRVRLN